jgi:hypothetical protein
LIPWLDLENLPLATGSTASGSSVSVQAGAALAEEEPPLPDARGVLEAQSAAKRQSSAAAKDTLVGLRFSRPAATSPPSEPQDEAPLRRSRRPESGPVPDKPLDPLGAEPFGRTFESCWARHLFRGVSGPRRRRRMPTWGPGRGSEPVTVRPERRADGSPSPPAARPCGGRRGAAPRSRVLRTREPGSRRPMVFRPSAPTPPAPSGPHRSAPDARSSPPGRRRSE